MSKASSPTDPRRGLQACVARIVTSAAILLGVLAGAPDLAVAGPPDHLAHAVKVTILSTSVAGDPRAGVGEWGFAALVEADGHALLYDTGAAPGLVLDNAKALHIDLSKVEEVVISHDHPDHVGGLLSLRQALMTANPAAMSRVDAGDGIFAPRHFGAAPRDLNAFNAIRAAYEQSGGVIRTHAAPIELAPGVWLTGPVPRKTAEHYWQAGVTTPSPSGPVQDTVAEDSALVIRTPEGLIVLTGCGHAGVINIAADGRRIAGPQPVVAIIGGLHLYAASDRTIDLTAASLRRLGVRYLLAGHCTGIEATIRLRRGLGLTRRTGAVAAVGSSFTLGHGIDSPEITR